MVTVVKKVTRLLHLGAMTIATVSVSLSGSRRPAALLVEQRISQDGELSHNRGDCDFGRLSGGEKSLILDVGVGPDRNQSWRIKHLA